MFKKFILVIFFSVLSINYIKANDKISYVNMDYLISNTIAGKLLLENLKK
jgi:Skp family chaperone for outer membrane proteins